MFDLGELIRQAVQEENLVLTFRKDEESADRIRIEARRIVAGEEEFLRLICWRPGVSRLG